MTHIDERVAALESRLADLSARLPLGETELDPSRSSRRDVFKKMAIGAAGVATAGTILVRTASPASAAPAGVDGGNITIDEDNVGTANATTTSAVGGTTVTWNSSTATPTAPAPSGPRVPSHGFSVADQRPTASTTSRFATTPELAAAIAGLSYSVLGNGVLGYSATAAGVVGNGTRAAFHAASSGTVANVVTLAHQAGDVIQTDDGSLWHCVSAGTPGGLRKLSGPTSAGQLHLLAAPVRVYDSRSNTGLASTGDGPLGAGSTRPVGLGTGYVGSAATPAVPTGATGALFTLTVANTIGGGFLSVYTNAVSNPGTSTINWAASGQFVATTTVAAVDATAKVAVTSGGTPASKADFIIDVIGYYL